MNGSKKLIRKSAILAALLAGATGLLVATSDSADIDEQVARLIEKTLDASTQAQAFAELEALGCEAVPFIIRRMDDRRPLPIDAISLENKSPGLWPESCGKVLA
jgi:hypothetical protein